MSAAPTFALACALAELIDVAGRSRLYGEGVPAFYIGTISDRSVFLGLSLTLTSITQEMIADLKQDSLRWQAERNEIDSRGYGGSSMRDPKTGRKPDKVLVDYTQSVTHQARQYYGATGQQTPQMPPGVPVSQGGPAQVPYGYDPNYTYAQPTGAYQPSGTVHGYPSPGGTEYELQGREPRSQAYPYAQPQVGGIQTRGIPASEAEAQAAYYYATQGQPMPAGRGQPYVQPQPAYTQAPPRETYGAREPHGARDDGGRRRRDR